MKICSFYIHCRGNYRKCERVAHLLQRLQRGSPRNFGISAQPTPPNKSPTRQLPGAPPLGLPNRLPAARSPNHCGSCRQSPGVRAGLGAPRRSDKGRHARHPRPEAAAMPRVVQVRGARALLREQGSPARPPEVERGRRVPSPAGGGESEEEAGPPRPPRSLGREQGGGRPLTAGSAASPSMAGPARCHERWRPTGPAGNLLRGLVGGPLRRWLGPGFGARGQRTDAAREERGGAKAQARRVHFAPCDAPGIPPRCRRRLRLLRTELGGGPSRQQGGAGRGGAVARATAPRRTKGRGGRVWPAGRRLRRELCPGAPPSPSRPSSAPAPTRAAPQPPPARKPEGRSEGGAGAGPGRSRLLAPGPARGGRGALRGDP